MQLHVEYRTWTSVDMGHVLPGVVLPCHGTWTSIYSTAGSLLCCHRLRNMYASPFVCSYTKKLTRTLTHVAEVHLYQGNRFLLILAECFYCLVGALQRYQGVCRLVCSALPCILSCYMSPPICEQWLGFGSHSHNKVGVDITDLINRTSYNIKDVAVGLQDFVICIEMFFAAVVRTHFRRSISPLLYCKTLTLLISYLCRDMYGHSLTKTSSKSISQISPFARFSKWCSLRESYVVCSFLNAFGRFQLCGPGDEKMYLLTRAREEHTLILYDFFF